MSYSMMPLGSSCCVLFNPVCLVVEGSPCGQEGYDPVVSNFAQKILESRLFEAEGEHGGV